MGYVWKRGRYWYAQVTKYSFSETIDGKQVRRRKRATKGGFTTKRDAMLYIETLRTAEPTNAPCLIELYQNFETHELPKLSKSKQDAYKIARRRIDSLMGIHIDELTVANMQGVIDCQGDSYYKARDIKNLLSKLYQLAMPDQYVTVNLTQFLSLPENQEKEADAFTEQEVDRMWEAYADGELFVGYLLLMIYSGMMPGELFSCEKQMIDLEKCEIYGCGKKTKTRKQSAIVFAECVRPVVEELIAWQQGEKLVNVHETVWYDNYHATIQKIGVRDLPPYSCRHTTGTEAARQNINAATIQKIMRHAKITTSQRYIHLGTEDTHRGLSKLPAKQK